jgi:hypothetical protein
MMKVLNDSLKPNLAYKSWIYEYYDSIYIENRLDIDCHKMLFLIKFKIFYNFINDNADVNDIISNCMNLTKVRNTFNYFNDSFYHQNYMPKVIPMINHQIYEIIIWVILSLVLFGLTLSFIRYL